MYSSGLKLAAALIWNQNPNFETASRDAWIERINAAARPDGKLRQNRILGMLANKKAPLTSCGWKGCTQLT